MSSIQRATPLVLVILDGWGVGVHSDHNAISKAHTPNWDRWWATEPHTLLEASGRAVGLPDGQMGSSEVGHLHIGAGRLVPQDYTRIDQAIRSGDFDRNEAFIAAMEHALAHDKALHIMGLLSPGGVHSHENQLYALLRLAAKQGVKKCYVHAFLDGRDTPPKSAHASLAALDTLMKELGCGQIASIMGRYYAMDRDGRWDRVKRAYDLLTEGRCEKLATDAASGLDWAYDQDYTDEFVPAILIKGAPAFASGDSVIAMNFRADRMRQLSAALLQADFKAFERHKTPTLGSFVSLTDYAPDLPAKVAFPKILLQDTLGACLAAHDLQQLRMAETEKYAHVTFFFNGRQEQACVGEDRILIPSPSVTTYDQQPKMSAPMLTERLIKTLRHQAKDFVVVNYANADMVGHSGNFEATVAAVECLDECLGQLHCAVKELGGELLITADHGNAECLHDGHQAHTAHTANPVPCIYLGRSADMMVEKGSLIDIAPTVLYLLGLTKPKVMEGCCLLRLLGCS